MTRTCMPLREDDKHEGAIGCIYEYARCFERQSDAIAMLAGTLEYDPPPKPYPGGLMSGPPTNAHQWSSPVGQPRHLLHVSTYSPYRLTFRMFSPQRMTSRSVIPLTSAYFGPSA